MRRSITRAVAAILTVIAVSLAGLPLASAEPASASTDPAVIAAADWLASKQGPSGLVTAGFDPTSDTISSIISWSAAGVHQASIDAAIAALAGDVDTAVRGGAASDQAGRVARLILATVSAGQNPRAFGGADLVARLTATRTIGGPDDGLYGSPNIFGSSFTVGLALLALHAVGSADAGAVDWLLNQQCADGSWYGYRSDLLTPCPHDPANFVFSDTNGTALAAQGLASMGTAPLHDTLAYFAAMQLGDGGWGYDDSSGSSDPDSTGLVISAIAALGSSVASPTFTFGACDPATALRSFQFGADATAPGEPGAFFYPPFVPGEPATPNVVSANDAIPALLITAPATPPVVHSTTTTTTVAPTVDPVRPPAVGSAPLTQEQRFALAVSLMRPDEALRFATFLRVLSSPQVLSATRHRSHHRVRRHTVHRRVCHRKKSGKRTCRRVTRRVVERTARR